MCCTATRFSHHDDCICDVGHRPHFFRRFLSKEERIVRLTEYKEELSKELQQVEAHIADIKNE